MPDSVIPDSVVPDSTFACYAQFRCARFPQTMAGPIGLKLGGMIEGMGENVLAKEFFGSVKVDRGQVGRPQVPLLSHGDDRETPNWL